MLVSLILSLGLCEIVLRACGFGPGYVPRYSNKGFRPVDKLEVSDEFFTDTEGVFRANPAAKWSSDYAINSAGFRSEPFRRPRDGKPSMLLLGDSFAWGASARPITNCFADIIRRGGYHVFNAGIPATDPKQYAYLAEKWIPVLRPNVVAVVFYMGNDIHRYRPMLPNKDLCHVTNVGWLQAFTPSGEWMTPQEAYLRGLLDANAARGYLFDQRTTVKATIKRQLFKTAVGTVVWVKAGSVRASLFSRTAATPVTLESGSPLAVTPAIQPKCDPRVPIMKEARSYLDRIRAVTKAHDALLLLFIVPVNPEAVRPHQTVEANETVFRHFMPLVPTELTAGDYEPSPDDHFNNHGHRKYARFMLFHIEKAIASERGQNTQIIE